MLLTSYNAHEVHFKGVSPPKSVRGILLAFLLLPSLRQGARKDAILKAHFLDSGGTKVVFLPLLTSWVVGCG